MSTHLSTTLDAVLPVLHCAVCGKGMDVIPPQPGRARRIGHLSFHSISLRQRTVKRIVDA